MLTTLRCIVLIAVLLAAWAGAWAGDATAKRLSDLRYRDGADLSAAECERGKVDLYLVVEQFIRRTAAARSAAPVK